MVEAKSKSGNVVRNISDTALWVAVYRANESDRSDAHFRDPFARKLAGERGAQIMESMPPSKRHSWAYVARTYLIDKIVNEQVAQGVDMVVNLAAGLDTRPYRMNLPASLKWVEVELPELLAYKKDMLREVKPRCELQQIALDLSDVAARRELFAKLGAEAKKVLVISEGLMVYLSQEENAAFAEDLARQPSFQYWVIDPASPALLKMLQKQVGKSLEAANAPLKFAPEEGPDFYIKYGWKPVEVNSMLKAGAQLKRLPFLMKLFTLFPDPAGKDPKKPWSAVCLMGRA